MVDFITRIGIQILLLKGVDILGTRQILYQTLLFLNLFILVLPKGLPENLMLKLEVLLSLCSSDLLSL